MKNNIIIAGAMLLTTAVSSCHKDSDVLLNYAYEDHMTFSEADTSFAGKFRVFWNAMNQNYNLWDYEKECGLDWDAVYDEYLPKFEALDMQDTNVADTTLYKLMSELVAPLHDGHMSVYFKNHQTGQVLRATPSEIRNADRPEFEESINMSPSMETYNKLGMLKRFMKYDVSIYSQLQDMLMKEGVGLQWVKTKLDEFAAKDDLSESEVILYDGLNELKAKLEPLVGKSPTGELLNVFNAIALKYSYLNVPFLQPIDPKFSDYGIDLQFALTNDNIAYLRISEFSLSVYLNDTAFKQEFGDNARDKEIRQNVVQVWKAWFDSIQELHKTGKLGGVIIDVRRNPGGMVTDAQYVLGALLPSGDLQYGWSRYKRGVGRYDYSPYTPQYMQTMNEPHEIIDDKPIVVLANAYSISMAEMTSLSTKQIDNAVLIGTRTYGGLCGLVGNEYNTETYSGHIGLENVTSVHVYLPTDAVFDMDKKCLEGIGVIPDIEVAYDATQYEETGRDTQIDRALEYIRTGK